MSEEASITGVKLNQRAFCFSGGALSVFNQVFGEKRAER